MRAKGSVEQPLLIGSFSVRMIFYVNLEAYDS